MTDASASRRAGLFKKLLLAGVLTLIPLLLFDLALRFWITQLPMSAQNVLLSRYFVGRDGIYFRESRWNMHNMKPDFRTPMFYNGYRWHHRTNAMGLREAEDFETAGMVLLGDSQIYGHGLEVPETLSENLKRLTGQRAANLGIQGDYPPFQFLRLRELALFYKPQLVLWFSDFDQDMSDYRTMKPDQKTVDFMLSGAVPDYEAGFRACRYLEGYRPDPWEHFTAGLKLWFPSLRVLHFARTFSAWRFRASSSAPEAKDGPWNSKLFLADAFTRFMETGDRICRSRGARLVMIVHPQTHLQEELREKVRLFCEARGIPYLDLRPVFQARSDFKELFLAGDGHYSARGTSLAAQTITDFLRARGLLEPAGRAAA